MQNQFNQSLWDNIAKIDLSQIRLRLVHRKGLSEETAVQSIARYRQYLYLSASNQFGAITPDKLVDEVWHDHILDMEKYERDCLTSFGFVIKHVPSWIDPTTPNPTARGKRESKKMSSSSCTGSACSSSTCEDGKCSGGLPRSSVNFQSTNLPSHKGDCHDVVSEKRPHRFAEIAKTVAFPKPTN